MPGRAKAAASAPGPPPRHPRPLLKPATSSPSPHHLPAISKHHRTRRAPLCAIPSSLAPRSELQPRPRDLDWAQMGPRGRRRDQGAPPSCHRCTTPAPSQCSSRELSPYRTQSGPALLPPAFGSASTPAQPLRHATGRRTTAHRATARRMTARRAIAPPVRSAKRSPTLDLRFQARWHSSWPSSWEPRGTRAPPRPSQAPPGFVRR
jgi:hypothetical protein